MSCTGASNGESKIRRSKQPPGHVAASAGVLTDSSGEVIDRWSLLQMDCVLLEDGDDDDDW